MTVYKAEKDNEMMKIERVKNSVHGIENRIALYLARYAQSGGNTDGVIIDSAIAKKMERIING